MKFDFLQARNFELDRKDKLTAALTLPVGVLGGLGSVLVAMVKTFDYSDSALWWVFVPSIVACASAFLACLATLWPAYYRQEYSYLPLLRELEHGRTSTVNSTATWRGLAMTPSKRFPTTCAIV